jgi:hypothetical protein
VQRRLAALIGCLKGRPLVEKQAGGGKGVDGKVQSGSASRPEPHFLLEDIFVRRRIVQEGIGRCAALEQALDQRQLPLVGGPQEHPGCQTWRRRRAVAQELPCPADRLAIPEDRDEFQIVSPHGTHDETLPSGVAHVERHTGMAQRAQAGQIPLLQTAMRRQAEAVRHLSRTDHCSQNGKTQVARRRRCRWLRADVGDREIKESEAIHLDIRRHPRLQQPTHDVCVR